MRYTDMSIYSATRDMPSGPIIVEEEAQNIDGVAIIRDQDGNITNGGFIGYLAAYAVMAGAILCCMFLL